MTDAKPKFSDEFFQADLAYLRGLADMLTDRNDTALDPLRIYMDDIGLGPAERLRTIAETYQVLANLSETLRQRDVTTNQVTEDAASWIERYVGALLSRYPVVPQVNPWYQHVATPHSHPSIPFSRVSCKACKELADIGELTERQACPSCGATSDLLVDPDEIPSAAALIVAIYSHGKSVGRAQGMGLAGGMTIGSVLGALLSKPGTPEPAKPDPKRRHR